jgi:hypothetical protein
MKSWDKQARQVCEGFLGELTDAALEAASRHGVYGVSVDQEVDFWHALGEALGRRKAPCTDGVGRTTIRREDFLAELSDAAYQEALRHGFRDSFLDVRLDLWKALRRVLWEGRYAGPYFRAACEGTSRPWRTSHAAIA